MKKLSYFCCSLFSVFIYQAAIVLAMIVGGVVGLSVDEYVNSNEVSLANLDVVALFKGDVSAASLIGMLFGSLIAITIFKKWISNIVKKDTAFAGLKRPASFFMIAIAVAGQAIINTFSDSKLLDSFSFIYESFKGSGVSMIRANQIFLSVVLAVLTAVALQLLCRWIAIYYFKKITNNTFVLIMVQAVLIAAIQYNWMQAFFTFALGIILGILFIQVKENPEAV